jgi:hypothetical protein
MASGFGYEQILYKSVKCMKAWIFNKDGTPIYATNLLIVIVGKLTVAYQVTKSYCIQHGWI